MYPTFNYFLQAYFYQSWQDEVTTSLNNVALFVEKENISNILSLENELKDLLNNRADLDKIFSTSKYFNPIYENYKNLDWLETALEVFENSLKNFHFNYAEIKHDPVKNAFYQEFNCHYIAGELPIDWTEDYFLNNWAKGSVIRLTAKIDNKLLISILDKMLNNRQFYFNQLVSYHSEFDWINDEDDWQEFKKLLQKMIEILNENKKSIMDYAGSTTGLYGNTTEERQAYLKNERDSWE